MAREITLLLHFLGFGLIVTLSVSGFILERHYRKATDLATKATILRAAKTFGLLSPFAILTQLVSGIGNMHALGYGLLTEGWLSAKIILFVVASLSGVFFGIISRKRGVLVGQMAAGKAPADAEETVKGYDRQASLFHVVMPVLLIMILCLSIYGRLGGQ